MQLSLSATGLRLIYVNTSIRIQLLSYRNRLTYSLEMSYQYVIAFRYSRTLFVVSEGLYR